MDAAVIKLNSLPDPVGAAAQDHNLGPVRIDSAVIRRIVGRIIVSIVLCSAYMNTLPRLCYAYGNTALTDIRLGNLQYLT